jgi:hypothetical protein
MNSHSEACQVPEPDDRDEQFEAIKEAIAEAEELMAEFAIQNYLDAQRLEWELRAKGTDPDSSVTPTKES